MKYKIINRKKLFATILLDIIGSIVFLPTVLFRKKTNTISNIHDILIIRTAYVGDIMMTVPILRPLKEKFPTARISFVASKEGGELLRGNPYIDRIFRLNPFWFYPSSIREYLNFIRSIRKERFDLVIEARGDIRELLGIVFPVRSRFKLSYDFGGGAYLLSHVVPFGTVRHRVEYHLDMVRYLGCGTNSVTWGVYLDQEEEKRIRTIMTESGITKPFIAIHPGARLPLKQWMTERYAALCDMITREYSMPLVLVGSEKEQAVVNSIVERTKVQTVSLAGKLSLRELAGILKAADLFICNDSAPMHIAASMKTPTVAIFGPSKSVETAPYGCRFRVVEKICSCRFSCDESVCNHSQYHECMRSITPEDVYEAVNEILA